MREIENIRVFKFQIKEFINKWKILQNKVNYLKNKYKQDSKYYLQIRIKFKIKLFKIFKKPSDYSNC